MSRVVNLHRREIEYRLHIIGIRVTADACQLIVKNLNDEWTALGHRSPLPFHFATDAEQQSRQALDCLRVTASQYVSEYPGCDLREVLAKEKSFDSALREESGTAEHLFKKASWKSNIPEFGERQKTAIFCENPSVKITSP